MQASTYQAAILMCFNTADEYSVAQIRGMVECEQPFFNQVLLSLLKGEDKTRPPLLVLNDESEDVSEKDLESGSALVRLNANFKRFSPRIFNHSSHFHQQY